MSVNVCSGFLVSLDDFYLLGSGLMMTQTTNNVFNTSLYSYITPASLFSWQRVRLAHALANTGEQWAKTFSRYNSGQKSTFTHLQFLMKLLISWCFIVFLAFWTVFALSCGFVWSWAESVSQGRIITSTWLWTWVKWIWAAVWRTERWLWWSRSRGWWSIQTRHRRCAEVRPKLTSLSFLLDFGVKWKRDMLYIYCYSKCVCLQVTGHPTMCRSTVRSTIWADTRRCGRSTARNSHTTFALAPRSSAATSRPSATWAPSNTSWDTTVNNNHNIS